MEVVRSGVCVLTARFPPSRIGSDQPRIGQTGILARYADGIWGVSASYLEVAHVRVGDEIAVFDRFSEKGKPAVATGDVVDVSIVEPNGGDGWINIYFTSTDNLIYRENVMPSKHSHYYEILSDGTRRPKKSK